MADDLIQLLRQHRIQPSTPRIAIAEFVLGSSAHPSADEILAAVQARLPVVARATVYNTLRVLVERGLIRELVLADGKRVYDPNLAPHHHFIDEDTGAIHDVEWDALRVSNVEQLSGYDVRDYQVVLRGRRRTRRKSN